MSENFFKIFKDKRLYEEENVISQESDMDKILKKSSKIKNVLFKIFTPDGDQEDLKSIITDIKCVQKNPTVFRISIKNGSFLDIKYNPTPMQIKSPEDFKTEDAFTVIVSGKRFKIGSRSEYQQCLDYVGKLMGENPVLKSVEQPEDIQGEEAPEENPDPESDGMEDDSTEDKSKGDEKKLGVK